MFRKILIANRGEIAVRIIRACREMGIRTAAIFSEADRESLHVRFADEAYPVGAAVSIESYLKIDRIVDVAKKSGAEAIHPGYGFLSENPDFAEACRQAGIVFIGPTPEAMKAMGNKVYARELMSKSGVPVVPGSGNLPDNAKEIKKMASDIGYPVIIKASAGGGGKGMRIVENQESLDSSIRAARSEAKSAFGDPSIYMEKYFSDPRHIEVQIMADLHGQIVHLFERECSVQRRHQKLVEESPSPVVDSKTREKIGQIAAKAALAVNYTCAGTIEFLRSEKGDFYFMEVNARLQVEHPVTEMITGIDLVKEMIRITHGEKLSFKQEDLRMRGAAIECRIYAEDPANDFMPSPGRIKSLRIPEGPGIRHDSGIFSGYEIPIYYDPLVAKVIAWGKNREEALSRMGRALEEYSIQGVKTTVPFHQKLLKDKNFLKGDYNTSLIKSMDLGQGFSGEMQDIALIGAAIAAFDIRREKRPEQKLRKESQWKLAGRRRFLDTRL
jgi:acetyl-CoA carboxylase biotin carboxylase subunit